MIGGGARCQGPRWLGDQTVRGDADQVLLRSKVRAVSRRMGFHEVARERMELVCNELITNQLKYAAGRGMIQFWEVAHPAPALDLFALDYGPGVADLRAVQADGFTTAGTLGKGLGAIRRLAHETEAFSIPQGAVPDGPWHGMAVWARFYVEAPRPSPAVQSGAFLRAYQDDAYNGDAQWVLSRDGGLRWLHLDGLGHGREAAEGVARTADVLDGGMSLEETLDLISRRLRGSRGAVAMVADVDTGTGRARVAGVGDMKAYLVLNGRRHNIGFAPGVLGHAHRSFEEQVHEFPSQALMLTASDGIRSTWTLRSFPGLWRLHPQLIALMLGNTVRRSNDDQSLFVVRPTPQSGDDDGEEA